MFLLLLCFLRVRAQQDEDHAELMALNEDDLEMKEAELMAGSNRPLININAADRASLSALGILSEKQLDDLFRHMENFGKLLSKYELQSIEGWDQEVARRILPFIVVEENEQTNLKQVFSKGRSMMLLRIHPGWFLSRDSSYAGNMSRFMSKFQYNSKFFKGGILIEKDPGEKKLYDHLSFHLEYDLKKNWLKRFIAGDFTVSFGQGLIQWQGYGFGRGGDVQTVQKPMASIKAYHGANEYNFHRGFAAQFQFKKINASIFASYKKLDGNLDGDTLRSISTGGLHRTGTEINNSNIASVISSGFSVVYPVRKAKFSLNGVHYTFDHHFQKRPLPYNHYGINSNSWMNLQRTKIFLLQLFRA
jgi:hypothetical protein